MENERPHMHQALLEVERQIGKIVTSAPSDLQDEETRLLMDRLSRMWETTMELQRALATPAVVEGYRADAVAQILRVGELINELGMRPGALQLQDVCMAAELAAAKVRQYWAMANIATTALFLTGLNPAKEATA